MEYVRVTFDSARLILSTNKKNADSVCKYNKETHSYNFDYRPESEYITFNEDIMRFEPICNMMHVLFGERPVSTLRGNGSSKLCNEIIDITKNGLYRVDNIISYKLGDNVYPITELTLGKKNRYSEVKMGFLSLDDVDKTDGIISWDILKRRYKYSDIDKYTDIVNHIEMFCGIKNVSVTKSLGLLDCFRIIRNSNVKDEACKYFELNKLTQISNFIKQSDKGARFSGTINRVSDGEDNYAALSVNNYPCYTITLSGQFLFPVTDEQFSNLLNNSGFATYLDDGIARLEPMLIDVPYYELERFKKIKDLKSLCE